MRKDGLGAGRHQIRSHIFVADVSDGFDDIVAMFRAPEHSIPVLAFPVVGFFGMINLKNRVSTDYYLRMNIIFSGNAARVPIWGREGGCFDNPSVGPRFAPPDLRVAGMSK